MNQNDLAASYHQAFSACETTAAQDEQIVTARSYVLSHQPLFAVILLKEMVIVPVDIAEIPWAATDSKRIYWNVKGMATLTVAEQAFVICHEVWHGVCNHVGRAKNYSYAGHVNGTPWSKETWNVVTDLVINALLVDGKIGKFKTGWLFSPAVSADELPEERYDEIYKEDNSRNPPNRGQGFDVHLPSPGIDADGKPEPASDPNAMKEALAEGASVARAQGKLPASLDRAIRELLEDHVDWEDKLRFSLSTHAGRGQPSYARPNRRRILYNQFMPGQSRYGCEALVCAIDTSGSIGQDELDRFFATAGGAMEQALPEITYMVWCDAQVQRVDEFGPGEDLTRVLKQGAPGGGGTDFRPVFDWVARDHIRPDALIYLTDTYGTFPKEKPNYPVIWCSLIKDATVPWGDFIFIPIKKGK